MCLLLNVQGVESKLCDTDFIQFISRYDILFLTETWTSNRDCIDVNGFDYISCNRPRGNKKAKRDSGGIIVYYKNCLHDKIEVLKKNQNGILWLKLKKDFFFILRTMLYFVLHTYLPKNQMYTKM